MSRPSWDEYFLSIAREVSRRSTCKRRQVGAILVKDKRILTTGYNGAPRGLEHCEVTGCLRETLGLSPGERVELCRGLHAEMNALLQGAIHGVRVDGATLYTTDSPCVSCAKMLINCGIKRIVSSADYPDPLAKEMLAAADVEVALMPASLAGRQGPNSA